MQVTRCFHIEWMRNQRLAINPILFPYICREHKLYFNLQLTKHFSWCLASEKSITQPEKKPQHQELKLPTTYTVNKVKCCYFAFCLSMTIQQNRMYSLMNWRCLMFTSGKKKAPILKQSDFKGNFLLSGAFPWNNACFVPKLLPLVDIALL